MRLDLRLLAAVGLATGLVLGATSGCSSSGGRTQATIGPAGGSLSLENVQLDIPAGALSGPVDVALAASSDARGMRVSIEPDQLALATPASLSVSLPGASHLSSVTEVSSGGMRPLGVDVRVEGAGGAGARLRIPRFLEVRFSTEVAADGGSVAGACRRHDEHDGEDDGEDSDDDGEGDHHDRADAGYPRFPDGGVTPPSQDAGMSPDGGILSMDCPEGFECEDGVCVAEEDFRPCVTGTDAGLCPLGEHCHEGLCIPDERFDAGQDHDRRDGGHEGDRRDGGHDDGDGHEGD